ncbi:MAG: ABC transporter ATP-binding protein [Flavobacteriaceae bacterium]
MTVENILEVRDLSVDYGAQPAVRSASFTVPAGSATALVGANGAGKTSALLAIAGALPRGAAMRGTVAVHGPDAAGAVSLIPEQDKVFALLTIDENLRLVARRRSGGRFGLADAYEWFPRLGERRNHLAGNLSGGEQQMLALAMGLLGSPRLLLIDEPTLGLAVPVIEMLCEKLARLRGELGVSILLAEADANWLAELATRAVVLDRGAVLGEWSGDLAAKRDEIHHMTLGLEEAAAS